MDVQPALRATDVSVAYGGVQAVRDVSFDVAAGELVGLIGPNGAGKTSTIDALTGFARHAGSVEVAGTDVSGRPPHVRARAGLGRTWQGIEVFDDLTVREHCTVAARRSGRADVLVDLVRPRRRGAEEAVERALAVVGLEDVADELPATLPRGHRQLVGVARALAGEPSVLLLDEPAAGLDTDESASLGVRLRELVADGLAVLLVEHDTRLVLDVCDRVIVLDDGAVIADGRPAEVRVDPVVVAAYLGAGVDGPELP